MKTLIIESWRTIGPELKAERKKQGKTRKDLIENSCYLHKNTMYLIETNKVKPTLPTLAEWARVLGYDEIVIRFGG